MNKSTIWTVILLLILAVPLGASTKILSPGDFFPQYSFKTDISSADAAYLGVAEVLGRSGEFHVEDVWGEVLVLELFNRFCFGCQQGAPLVNRVYEMVASDPTLSTKVRFLGIGVGNNMKTVNDFRREFDVQFPLVPDPKFGILTALGNPGGTPYTMILKKTSGGLMLMASHFGVLDSAQGFVDEIKEIATGDAEQLLAGARPVELPPWVEKELVPSIPETEIEARVLKSMERAGYGSVGLYTVDLPDGDRVFIGESNRGKVFSRVISRLPVCDVCHPVHFILTLNTRGVVVDFDAISVTKYWNKEWNEEEVDQMRRKLLGLSALEDRAFDPQVDAVSTATMSSSLIFDSLSKTGPIVKILKEKGHF
ncbi:MAG: hypothetical protein RRA15_13685 [bacterium]|nr:hypothetical protein [bacterium]MDT8367510.1 hypothetical protein [bacterium]